MLLWQFYSRRIPVIRHVWKSNQSACFQSANNKKISLTPCVHKHWCSFQMFCTSSTPIQCSAHVWNTDWEFKHLASAAKKTARTIAKHWKIASVQVNNTWLEMSSIDEMPNNFAEHLAEQSCQHILNTLHRSLEDILPHQRHARWRVNRGGNNDIIRLMRIWK